MKRPLYLMVTLTAIALVGPLIIKKPDGTAFIEIPFFQSSSPANTPSITSSNILSRLNSSSSPEQSFYKWQDDDGTWHYSDEAPADRNSKTVTVNTNTNLIQGLRPETPDNDSTAKVSTPEKSANQDTVSPNIPLPMTIPLEKVHKVLEDAHNIQNIMDSRAKQFDVNN